MIFQIKGLVLCKRRTNGYMCRVVQSGYNENELVAEHPVEQVEMCFVWTQFRSNSITWSSVLIFSSVFLPRSDAMWVRSHYIFCKINLKLMYRCYSFPSNWVDEAGFYSCGVHYYYNGTLITCYFELIQIQTKVWS